MMRVVITGGAGFIGSSLVRDFLNKNFEVAVIDNLSFGNKRNIQGIPADNFYEIDILDSKGLARTFRKITPDVVIHLAAIHFIPYCNKYPYESANINLQGTNNLLDACRSTESVRQIVFASTAAVYPIVSGAISEEVSPEPSDIYGLSKAVGERLFHEYYLQTGVSTTICRFFNAFGPNETNPHLIPSIVNQIREGVRKISIGNLTPKRDYIHTIDISEAIIGLLANSKMSGYEVFNIGSGREYSVSEIIDAFNEHIGYELEAVQEEDRIRKVDRPHLLADISKISAYLGWTPRISLKDGIKSLLSEHGING